MSSAPSSVASPPPENSTVLLLDLRKEARGFFQAENLHDAAERLVAEGFDVRLVRSVATLRGDNWSTRIASYVRDVDPRVIVIERLWDEAMLALLKGAGRAVVRLNDGHETALDDGYDAILDEEALVAWLQGDKTGDRAAFRPTTRELRARKDAWQPTTRKLRFEVLEDPDDELAIGRAVIRGPAEGCPFLLDARRNEVFAGLDMDGMQHRGCSFCLDNLGAFAMPKPEAVVDAWVKAARDARAADPSLREIVLADERPHPNLPALFEALASDPALHGLAILIKTRVDWLLEFADTALAEALTIAPPAGLQLHIYLVGFESFEPFHLQLFNKGVTVADNVAAIACLERLQAAHGDAFEYRRYRAHGIVLFTPWTTPEHLLAGAEVMHQTGFSALRSGAWRTRLRIHPGLPLHALALRDGLTETAFPKLRPDRAREQGYNASIPWRFADTRTTLAFAILQELAWRLERRMDESLVVGIVAAFVRDNPALADEGSGAAAIAHLPLLAGLIAHGPSVMDAGWHDVARLALDADIQALRDGNDPEPAWIVRREPLPFTAADLAAAYRFMGLAADVAGHEGERVVVARSESALQAALSVGVDSGGGPGSANPRTVDVMKVPRLDGAVAALLADGSVACGQDARLIDWSPVLRGIELRVCADGLDEALAIWVLPREHDTKAGWTTSHHQLAHQPAPAGWDGPRIDGVMGAARDVVQRLEETAQQAAGERTTKGLPKLPRRQDEALSAIAHYIAGAAFEPSPVHAHWTWRALRKDLHGGCLVLGLERGDGARFDVIARRRGEMDHALAQTRWLDLAHGELPESVPGVQAHAAIDALAVAVIAREESAAEKGRKEPNDLSPSIVDDVAGGVDELGSPLEKLAFRIGLKPVVRLERVPFASWREVAAAVATDAHAAPGTVRYAVGEHGRVDDEAGPWIDLFVGHEAADVDRIVHLDGIEKAGGDVTSTHEIGRLLGYPTCCTEAFVDTHQPGANTDWPLVIAERSGPGPWSWVVSPLPVDVIVLPFMPCRFDCDAAIAWGGKLVAALRGDDRVAASRIESAHRRAFVYRGWDDFEVAVEGGSQTGVILEFTDPTRDP